MFRRARLATLVGFLGFCVPCADSSTAIGQDAADGGLPPESDAGSVEGTAQPALAPPQLLERVEASYPADAAAQKLEATVGLRILVQADGSVSEAEVVEPAGHGFDEPARDAVLRSRFRPATKDGQPIAARILFRYEFRLPEPAPPSVVAPLPEAVNALVAPLPLVPPVEPQPVEVLVRGKQTEEQRLQQSAEAVTVVSMDVAKKRSSDMGEVMARTFGVTVRRSGGLGSEARFSLDGLQADQIAFYVDGAPLELVFPSGIANAPVNLVDRVEIYRGVVPVRFGADALGGAINLVTDRSYETGGVASYQVGSYGVHRATLLARYRHEPSGFFVGAEGFVDSARNDYEIDVEVPDERGRLHPARVKRFHDGYFAYGAALELGFADVSWAKRLVVRPFISAYDKELQHNIVMSVPYGEVRYDERLAGGLVRYEQDLLPNLSLDVLGIFSHRTTHFVDKAKWVYDWYGERVRERRVPGEIESDPTDQTVWQKTFYARALLDWKIVPAHALRLSVAPERPTRTGDERIQADPNARDPLTAERKLFTLVSGLEYELNAFPTSDAPAAASERENGSDYIVQNVLFGKSYLYKMESEEPLPGGIFRERDKDLHRFGVGDGLRVMLSSWAFAKASYELTTRLPNAWEVFGDGVLVQANLELLPEVSHNVNLGVRTDLEGLVIGDVMVDLNSFYRDTDRQIVLLGNDRFFSYQNVYRARTKGFEGAVEWVSRGRYATIDGNVTYTDNRNASSEGTFGAFEGDRIPNRPWLTASWGGNLRFERLLFGDDAVEPFYVGRYVHEFFRGWESQGLREFKQVIETQITHGVGVTYSSKQTFGEFAATVEAQNLTDEQVYDVYGVQRPGRAFYLKVTGWI